MLERKIFCNFVEEEVCGYIEIEDINELGSENPIGHDIVKKSCSHEDFCNLAIGETCPLETDVEIL